MKHNLSALLLCAAIVSSGLASCASTPAPSSDTFAARLLDKKAIEEAFGSPYLSNPFVEPSGLLWTQKDEFSIAELDLELASPGTVGIDTAEIVDEKGAKVARLYDRDAFRAYWKEYDYLDEAKTRARKIDDACIPSLSFAAHKGFSRYYLVFVGPNPIPRPATLRLRLQLKGGEIREYEFPLPPAPLPAKGIQKIFG